MRACLKKTKTKLQAHLSEGERFKNQVLTLKRIDFRVMENLTHSSAPGVGKSTESSLGMQWSWTFWQHFLKLLIEEQHA